MKSFLLTLLLALSTAAHASTTSANHGHHGSNSGAVGAAPGAFGGSQAAAGQSGNGGRYLWVDLDASPVDQFQPFRQADMRNFEKSKFVPYDGK